MERIRQVCFQRMLLPIFNIVLLRSLLLDAGRPAKSLLRLPAGPLPAPKPKGMFFCPPLFSRSPCYCLGGPKALVWDWNTL